MPNELKPCPFCGGKARIEKGRTFCGNTFSVACADPHNCKGYYVKTKGFYSKNEAISVWNRRVDNV